MSLTDVGAFNHMLSPEQERRLFAAMAMQGLLANAGVISPYDTKYPGAMALCAVVFADALLTELAKDHK